MPPDPFPGPVHFSQAEISDPLVSGPGADRDGDGYPNFHHYAFGSNPGAADAPTHQPLVAINGNFLEITHPQRAAALDLEFVIETSADLKAWGAVDAPIIRSSPADLNSMVTVTRRDPRAIGAAQSDARRFVRVRAVKK